MIDSGPFVEARRKIDIFEGQGYDSKIAAQGSAMTTIMKENTERSGNVGFSWDAFRQSLHVMMKEPRCQYRFCGWCHRLPGRSSAGRFITTTQPLAAHYHISSLLCPKACRPDSAWKSPAVPSLVQRGPVELKASAHIQADLSIYPPRPMATALFEPRRLDPDPRSTHELPK